MVPANDRFGLTFCISPGEADDGQNGQLLLQHWKRDFPRIPLVMDRAYEGGPTRQCLERCGFQSVVPPKPNRLKPLESDKITYK